MVFFPQKWRATEASEMQEQLWLQSSFRVQELLDEPLWPWNVSRNREHPPFFFFYGEKWWTTAGFHQQHWDIHQYWDIWDYQPTTCGSFRDPWPEMPFRILKHGLWNLRTEEVALQKTIEKNADFSCTFEYHMINHGKSQCLKSWWPPVLMVKPCCYLSNIYQYSTLCPTKIPYSSRYR